MVLAQVDRRHKAEAVKIILENDGIASVVDADDAGGAYTSMSFSHPVRILVRSSDRDRTASLLEASPMHPG